MNVKSLTTMPNEHFNSLMRMCYPMPTQLEYAYAFIPTISEQVKQLCQTDYLYRTSSSYYKVPDQMIHINTLPKPTLPSSVEMSKSDQQDMRAFVEDFRPVRQKTVWQMTTMDRPGTLPTRTYNMSRVRNPNLMIQPMQDDDEESDSDAAEEQTPEQRTRPRRVIRLPARFRQT